MGKAILLIITAAVVGTTYLQVGQNEMTIAAADSHRYNQAEQFAEDAAMGGRTLIMSKMMAAGGGGFVDSTALSAMLPMDAAQAFNGRSELGHFTLERYATSATADTATFTVLGKHYKDYQADDPDGDGNPWVHAVHRVTTQYTTNGVPEVITLDPETYQDPLSCHATDDRLYNGGLDLSSDLHFDDTPRVVKVAGDLNIPNNKWLEGTGLLAIEGNLDVRGTLKWDGIVIVYNDANDMEIDLDQADDVIINGSFLVGDDVNVMDVLSGLSGNSSDGASLASLLNSLPGASFDFDMDEDDLTLAYDHGNVFQIAECVGLASYELAVVSNQIETFEDEEDDGHVCRNNNGHGNNADGVDSSNPGQGHGGPNGETDESCSGNGPCVDDENRP